MTDYIVKEQRNVIVASQVSWLCSNRLAAGSNKLLVRAAYSNRVVILLNFGEVRLPQVFTNGLIEYGKFNSTFQTYKTAEGIQSTKDDTKLELLMNL